MALTKEPFSVGFIRTKLPNTHKGEDTEGFTRVAWERGFKDGIAHNTGTPELAWEWKATRGLVHSVSSSHTSSTHPGLCYRVDISRGNDLLSLLYQQARNIKNNNIYNIWKPYFLISYFTWLLEELFWIHPFLHALLSALQVSRSGTSCFKTKPPTETCDKHGSNPTTNGDRGKLHQPGTNL